MDCLGGEPLRRLGLFRAPTFLCQAVVKSGGLAIGVTVSQDQGLRRKLLGYMALQEEEEEAGMGPRSP